MMEITAEIRALIDKAAVGMELAVDEYGRNETEKHHQNRPPPGLCDGNPHGQLRPYRFRLLQAGRNRHRSRQDDESAGSGNCCRTYATVQRISDDMEKRSRRGA